MKLVPKAELVGGKTRRAVRQKSDGDEIRRRAVKQSNDGLSS